MEPNPNRWQPHEKEWMKHFADYMDGHKEPLAEWIRNNEEAFPEDAREFLADLILGIAAKPKGRPRFRTAKDERHILALVWQAREKVPAQKTRPSEVAIERVAAEIGLMPEAVRGIKQRLTKSGLTFERWKKWGRPMW